jgi:hypothetical protein
MLDLVNTINLANPYTTAPTYEAANNDVVIEQQLDVGNWNFKGVPHHVEKAIRVSYTYTDENGVKIRDYLLIGYEGGGAY